MSSLPRIINRDYIVKLYKTPGHPVAFSSPQAIYKFFEGDVSLSMIQDALEHVDSYTLHREYKSPAVYNPYYTYRRRVQFQADLIDISSLKQDNDNVTFLLVIIDIFSRKIWVMPLKRKTGVATATALEDWFTEMEQEPGWSTTSRSFLTDSGKEFLNQLVRDLMTRKGMRMEQAKNIHKAAIVERVNKSLQVLIYKYLTDRGETKYLDVLSSLVKTYNNRKHRSLNYLSPNEADTPENQVIVRSIHLTRYAKINNRRTKKNYVKFKIGDTVRIKTHANAPSSARRAYLQQFHGEYFVVVKINRRMPIIMYEIKSMDTEEEIEGGFYANEMVPVRGDTFKIDKILETKGRGRKKKHLVQWKHFSSRWNSWVKDSDMVNE